MKKYIFGMIILIWAQNALAWKDVKGKVEVLYVNAYGNYSEAHLNNGYCFKLEGFDHYFKIKYFESGEQKNNLQIIQSMVLAAKLAGKELKVRYVDWGEDTSCRVNGAGQPAKWLENVEILDD